VVKGKVSWLGSESGLVKQFSRALPGWGPPLPQNIINIAEIREEGKRGKGRARGAFRQIKIYDYIPGNNDHNSTGNWKTIIQSHPI